VALDAFLAYLHFSAIFVLFGYLITEAIFIKATLTAEAIRRLGRIDMFYFGAAMAVLATGLLRLSFGAKGADYYLSWWPIYAKFIAFVLIAMISAGPTLTFVRWRRMLDHDPAWQVPEAEQRRVRRFIMLELHLAALIPAFAVIMSRGLLR
jgi:putative membrane protein